MSLGGAVAGGALGSLIMQAILGGAGQAGLTRIDIPFLLGTALTPVRSRARAMGAAAHLVLGLGFSLLYYAIFQVTGAGAGVGALLGLLHGVVAGTVIANILVPAVHPRMGTPLTGSDETPLLEPPGFLLMNYGTLTPIVSIVAHVAYGATVGAFAAL